MPGRRQIGLDDAAQHRSRRHVYKQDITPSTHSQPTAPASTVPHIPNIDPTTYRVKSSRSQMQNPVLPRQAKSVVLARQTVYKKPKKRVPHVSKRSRVSIVLVMMACFIFVGGSMVSYVGWKAGKNVDNQRDQQVLASNSQKSEVANTQDTASEEDILPEVIANYTVAADLPRLIRIPRLQVEARIKRIVASDTNEISAPNSIYDVGWYDASNLPGRDGVSLMTGYASGPTKSGIFHRLGVLKEGDTIEITRGDDKVFTYKVVLLEIVDHDQFDLARALTSPDSSKRSLTLVTFSERYDIRTNEYEQKNIVYAVEQ